MFHFTETPFRLGFPIIHHIIDGGKRACLRCNNVGPACHGLACLWQNNIIIIAIIGDALEKKKK